MNDDYLSMFYGRDENAPIGYAYAYKELRAALERQGVDFSQVGETVLYHSIPWGGFDWYESQRAGLSTMWEHSRVPEEMRKVLQGFHFVVTPCTHSAELFEPYVPEVHVVPYGINPDAFKPKRRPPKGRFTILANALNSRKGPAQAVEAFRLSGLQGDAKLVLKGNPEKIRKYLPSTLPTGVEFFSQTVSTEDLRDLYTSAHCYLSMSRGEGWDLMAWEALACGTPTVVPDHTGYREWNHLAQIRLESWVPQPSPVKDFGDPGDWNVMDAEEAAHALQTVYHDYESHREGAVRSSESMRRYHTWDHTAQTLLEALRPLRPLKRKGQKVGHEPTLLVETTQYLPFFDIGGYKAGPLKVGSRHHFPAEVARQLTRSGYVEPIE